MLQPQQVEKLMTVAAAMDRDTLVRQFGQYRGRIPVDLTPDFLRTESLDHLRHIFVALCLQSGRLPDGAVAA
jgi:hypothetical protein